MCRVKNTLIVLPSLKSAVPFEHTDYYILLPLTNTTVTLRKLTLFYLFHEPKHFGKNTYTILKL